MVLASNRIVRGTQEWNLNVGDGARMYLRELLAITFELEGALTSLKEWNSSSGANEGDARAEDSSRFHDGTNR